MGIGTLEKVWRKENSLKLVKILDSWKKITLMLSLNKLLTKGMKKSFKQATFCVYFVEVPVRSLHENCLVLGKRVYFNTSHEVYALVNVLFLFFELSLYIF